MNKALKKEIEDIIDEKRLHCSIEEFIHEINWYWVSVYRRLSDEFMVRYKRYLNWGYISSFQQLSEEFIAKHKDRVDWYKISYSQQLSEEFMEKYKNYLSWYYISKNQKLSEEFIDKHEYDVDWYAIAMHQTLSEEFITKHKDKGNISSILYNECHDSKSLKQKRLEVQAYANKYNLEYDEEYLYAFRTHNAFGNGMYKSNVYYEKGKYYRDWHCDMREDEENSFGLGIFPQGFVAVKVKISDWGLEVNREDGKCRVWGFEMI